MHVQYYASAVYHVRSSFYIAYSKSCIIEHTIVQHYDQSQCCLRTDHVLFKLTSLITLRGRAREELVSKTSQFK